MSPGVLGTAHDGFRDVAARPEFAGFVARVSQKNGDEYTTVATFFVPPAANREGPLLPRVGTIARRPALSDYGISVRTHNAAGAARDGFLEVALDVPPDVELISGIYDTALSSQTPEGENYSRGNRILSHTATSWTAYVRPPDEEHYVFRVFARRGGTGDYTTVLDVPLSGAEFAGAGPRTFPPPWKPILFEEFPAEGLTLEEISVSSERRELDRELTLIVRAPAGVELRALLRDVQGNNLDGRTVVEQAPTDDGVEYRMTIVLPSNPSGQPLAVQLYRYDGQYQLRMMMLVQ